MKFFPALLTILLIGFQFSGAAVAAETCYLEDYFDTTPVCDQSINHHISMPLNYLPGISFVEASSVTPAAAKQFYQGYVERSAVPIGSIDPSLKDMARALKYDASLIYQYTNHMVDFVPSFALKNGSRGVLLDDSGTALDQAAFVHDMLRISDELGGQNYNSKIIIGVLEFNGENGFLAAGVDWLGISDAKQLCVALANNGLPAKINGQGSCGSVSGSISSIEIWHAWVEATVGDQTMSLDPSFKVYESQETLDVRDVIDFDVPGFRTDLMESSSPQFIATGVSGLRVNDRDDLSGKVNQAAVDLVKYVRANRANDHSDDIIGFRRIFRNFDLTPHEGVLPYQKSKEFEFSGAVPNAFRTKVSLSARSSKNNLVHDATTLHTYTDVLYARKLLSRYRAGDNPGLSFNINDHDLTYKDIEMEHDPISGSFHGFYYKILVKVDHPYVAESGTYADALVSKVVPRNTGTSLVVGVGDLSPSKQRGNILKRRRPEESGIFRASTWDGDQEQLYRYIIGLTDVKRLMSKVNDVEIMHHQSVAIGSTRTSYTPALPYVDIQSSFSVSAKRVTDETRATASKEVLSAILNGIEALGVSGSSYLAPSSVTMSYAGMRSNVTGRNYYLQDTTMLDEAVRTVEINQQNVDAFLSTLRNRSLELRFNPARGGWMNNFNQRSLDLLEDYVAAGYKVYAPERPLVYRELGIERVQTEENIDCFVMYLELGCVFPYHFLAVHPASQKYAHITYIHKGVGAEIDSNVDAGEYITNQQHTDDYGAGNISLNNGSFTFTKPLAKVGSELDAIQLNYYISPNDPAETSYQLARAFSTDFTVAYRGRGEIGDIATSVVAISMATDLLASQQDLSSRVLSMGVVGHLTNNTHRNLGQASIKDVMGVTYTSLYNGEDSCYYRFGDIGSLIEIFPSTNCDVNEDRGVAQFYDLNGISYNFYTDPNLVLPYASDYVQSNSGLVFGTHRAKISFSNSNIIDIGMRFVPNPEGPVNINGYQRDRIEWFVSNSFDREVKLTDIRPATGPQGREYDFEGRKISWTGLSSIYEYNLREVTFKDQNDVVTLIQLGSGDVDYTNPYRRGELKYINEKSNTAIRVNFDDFNYVTRVSDAEDQFTDYYIANGWRGERVSATGASFIQYFDDQGRVIRQIEPSFDGVVQ